MAKQSLTKYSSSAHSKRTKPPNAADLHLQAFSGAILLLQTVEIEREIEREREREREREIGATEVTHGHA